MSTYQPLDLSSNMASRVAVDERGCWVWQGALNNKDYGQVSIGGKVRSTHRVAYELLVGPIPDGLHLDHLCRNRPCCNPAHLEPVTNKVNSERSERSGRTHCIRGHLLSGDNLVIKLRPNGLTIRNCRTCANALRRVSNRRADIEVLVAERSDVEAAAG